MTPTMQALKKAIESTYQIADPTHEMTLQAAAEFCLYCHLSFCGGGTRWSSGRRTKPSQFNYENLLLESARLVGVKLTSIDALDVIAQFNQPKDLIYLDPPYLGSACSSKDSRVSDRAASAPRRQYHHELRQENEHRQLLDAIVHSNAMIVISGYDSALYAEMLKGWTVVRRRSQKIQGSGIESLWLSPNACEMLSVA